MPILRKQQLFASIEVILRRWREILRPAVRLTLICSLTLAPAASGLAAEPPAGKQETDSRLSKLRAFLNVHRSPLERFAPQFLAAADRYKLDWRLLPSLAMIESGGGRVYRHNNIFGWRSGRAAFRSVDQAIDYVASRFGESPIYRGRDTAGILRKYNPARSAYVRKVLAIMDSIAPVAVLQAAAAH